MVHLIHGTLATLVAPPAIAPIPELGFVLQMLGAGGAIGSALALRMRQRHPHADTWTITTAWAIAGLALGVLVLVLEAV